MTVGLLLGAIADLIDIFEPIDKEREFKSYSTILFN
jgi:hypothetical protein